MATLDVPKFAYGPGQATVLVLSLPSTSSVKSLGTIGGDLEGDSGMRAAYVVVRSEYLNFEIRFFETEWPQIVSMIDTVMDGQQFLFYPVASSDESYFVTLDSPTVGQKYEPTSDPQYPRVFLLAIALCAPTFDIPE